MYLIPENFETYLESTINEVKNIKGHLPKRDLRFLCFLGMIPTTSGEVLEIGSFRGKSTVALAKSVEFFDIKNKINAVDPFILESVTDPLYKSEIPIKDEFLNNLKETPGPAARPGRWRCGNPACPAGTGARRCPATVVGVPGSAPGTPRCPLLRAAGQSAGDRPLRERTPSGTRRSPGFAAPFSQRTPRSGFRCPRCHKAPCAPVPEKEGLAGCPEPGRNVVRNH